jgi:hypothetical protein
MKNNFGFAPIYWIFIALGLIAGGGVYYFFFYEKEGVCVQVVSYARNKDTGECRMFNTPCDIPEEKWSEDSSCQNDFDRPDNFSCRTDDDCILFGEGGECGCGCYSKQDVPKSTGGDCFCLAPTACRCVSGQCQGIFEKRDPTPTPVLSPEISPSELPEESSVEPE